MNPEVERLLSYWHDQDLLHAARNSDDDLRTFERRHAVRFPGDMRSYLMLANGSASRRGSDADRNGFRFWPLHELGALPIVCARAGVPLPAGETWDQYVVFADYLDWSWAYAIDLSGQDPAAQNVVQVGTSSPIVVASTFSQFIDRYIQDSPVLYVHPGDRDP